LQSEEQVLQSEEQVLQSEEQEWVEVVELE
jgi:hypothetical protein